MNRPHFSVVIPTHNRAGFLSRALQSVLDQSWADFEIIVVDDGSTDDTAAMVRKCADRRVRLVQQPQGERAAARNKGIRLAQGEYIAFLDDDDLWAPTKLANSLRAFDTIKVGVVYTGWRYMDASEGLLPQAPHVPEKRGQVARDLLFDCWFPTSAAVVRRSSIERAGEFDDTLVPVEDWDLWIRIAGQGDEFNFASEPLLSYRLHEQNSTKALDRLEKSSHQMLDKAFSRVGSPHEDARDEAYARLYLNSSVRYLGCREIDAASRLFTRAVNTLPSLLEELPVYYQVICAMQPDGYKGTQERLDLALGHRYIERVLADSFSGNPELETHRRSAYGMAYMVLGRLYYGLGRMAEARAFFQKAVRANPALLGGLQVPVQWAKAAIPAKVVDLAKSHRLTRGR